MAQAAAAAEAPAKGGGKMKLIIAVVAAMGIGMGATWFLLGKKAQDGAHGEEKPAVKQEPSVFFPLETFTVNLVPEFGDQYLQVEITLKVAGQEIVDAMKARMPEIRNSVILILSSKRGSELTTVQGKSSLAIEIGNRLNMMMDPAFRPSLQAMPRVDAHGNPVPAPGVAPDPHAAQGTANPQQPQAPVQGVIREVLFTSFIIQ